MQRRSAPAEQDYRVGGRLATVGSLRHQTGAAQSHSSYVGELLFLTSPLVLSQPLANASGSISKLNQLNYELVMQETGANSSKTRQKIVEKHAPRGHLLETLQRNILLTTDGRSDRFTPTWLSRTGAGLAVSGWHGSVLRRRQWMTPRGVNGQRTGPQGQRRRGEGDWTPASRR